MRDSIEGRPHVRNDGRLHVGTGCRIASRPLRSHLLVMHDATLTLGNGVLISYGAAISARASVRIGDNTRIGPFCLILDNDFHKAGQPESRGEVAAIDIGRDVVLGARVTVLRGSRIGDGAHVMNGSTVAGVVHAGSVVSGVPARVGGRDTHRASARLVAATVMRVFELPRPPHPTDGADQIPGWNHMGLLRLLLALEETFGVTLPYRAVIAASSVGDLTRVLLPAMSVLTERRA